jgi:hypothetical protein
VANPKGDVPSNLGFEGKGAKVKGSKAKISFPFTDYCQMDSQGEDLPLKAPVCETRQIN